MAADLYFKSPLSTPPSADLLFGTGAGALPDVTLVVTATLPAPAVSASAIHVTVAQVTAQMPAFTVAASCAYDNAVYRTSSAIGNTWQDATRAHESSQQGLQNATPTRPAVTSSWQEATGAGTSVAEVFRNATKAKNPVSSFWTPATSVSASTEARFAEMLRSSRPQVKAAHGEGTSKSETVLSAWQLMDMGKRPATKGKYQKATPRSARSLLKHQVGTPAPHTHGERWQEARKPLPGTWFIPIVPPQPGDDFYDPPPGGSVGLLFRENAPAATSPELVFWVPSDTPDHTGTTIVPVRSAYIVINDIQLKRVSGSLDLPCFGLSMQIDADSWTWSFNASMPALALADVEPTGGNPVELEASINGLTYRFLAENISKERTFGSSRISVSGRGRSAVLADPYSPVQAFTNSEQRTAQQLMGDVLTINGAPLGWTVNWNVTDWLVPAGAFSHQGSYMSALNAIVGAIGGYILPHPTGNSIRVLNRYPVAPWEWDTVTPDFELPTAAVSKEAISWATKPDYNAVYVSGTSAGVLAQVKRTGTAGNRVAPMVTDPLITAQDAARQRGLSVLGNTGRISTITLELPILPETGIIEPGKFVRYVDGAGSKIGLVRGTSVIAGLPSVRQSLEIEVHA